MAFGSTCSLVVAAALLFAPPPPAETKPGVPFELVQQHLVVTKGAIGSITGLNLLIDTGTIPSVVDARLAKKLRLQTVSSVLVAFGQQVPSKALSSRDFRSAGFGLDQSGDGRRSLDLSGVRVDAIVGLDVLARASFSIDYQNRLLTIGPDAWTGRRRDGAGLAVRHGAHDHRGGICSTAARHRQRRSRALQEPHAGRVGTRAVER